MSNGLPPANTWASAAPCASNGDSASSIVDSVAITGLPGTITSLVNSQPAWSITLNDGSTPPDFTRL